MVSLKLGYMRSCFVLKWGEGSWGWSGSKCHPSSGEMEIGRSLGLAGKPAQTTSNLLIPVRSLPQKKERASERGREGERKGKERTEKGKGLKTSNTVKKHRFTLATALSSSF